MKRSCRVLIGILALLSLLGTRAVWTFGGDGPGAVFGFFAFLLTWLTFNITIPANSRDARALLMFGSALASGFLLAGAVIATGTLNLRAVANAIPGASAASSQLVAAIKPKLLADAGSKDPCATLAEFCARHASLDCGYAKGKKCFAWCDVPQSAAVMLARPDLKLHEQETILGNCSRMLREDQEQLEKIEHMAKPARR